jgi:hypothetical protein
VSRIVLSVLALSSLGALASCGGSSSETPFPLEPDLSRLDGGPSGQARYVVYTGEKSKPAPAGDDDRREPSETVEPEPPAK